MMHLCGIDWQRALYSMKRSHHHTRRYVRYLWLALNKKWEYSLIDDRMYYNRTNSLSNWVSLVSTHQTSKMYNLIPECLGSYNNNSIEITHVLGLKAENTFYESLYTNNISWSASSVCNPTTNDQKTSKKQKGEGTMSSIKCQSLFKYQYLVLCYEKYFMCHQARLFVMTSKCYTYYTNNFIRFMSKLRRKRGWYTNTISWWYFAILPWFLSLHWRLLHLTCFTLWKRNDLFKNTDLTNDVI